MTQEAPRYVADSLTTVPAPAPIQVGNNGSPGGYRFEPDQVQSIINKWQNLLADIKSDREYAQSIAMISPPGREFASGDFVSQGVMPSAQTLLIQHDRMFEYVQNYITALQQAAGQIEQTEADAQQAAAQQGKEIM